MKQPPLTLYITNTTLLVATPILFLIGLALFLFGTNVEPAASPFIVNLTEGSDGKTYAAITRTWDDVYQYCELTEEGLLINCVWWNDTPNVTMNEVR